MQFSVRCQRAKLSSSKTRRASRLNLTLLGNHRAWGLGLGQLKQFRRWHCNYGVLALFIYILILNFTLTSLLGTKAPIDDL